MDNYARLHCTRAVMDYLRGESITTLPWPVMNPYLPPIQHIWTILVVLYAKRHLLFKHAMRWTKHFTENVGVYSNNKSVTV